jgi:hypothetical protein
VSTFGVNFSNSCSNNKTALHYNNIIEYGLIICAAIDWDKNKVGSKSMENQA